MATRQTGVKDIEQLIADEFGVNADYVLELLQQFERAPDSIDEEWRSFFHELLTNGNVATDDQGRKHSPQAPHEAVEPIPHREESGISQTGIKQSAYQWGQAAEIPVPTEPAQEPTSKASRAVKP